MAGSLAVLGKRLERLVNERHVALVDVEAEQPESARRAAADTVEELQRLAHQVVVGLVVLVPEVVLKSERVTTEAWTGRSTLRTILSLEFNFNNINWTKRVSCGVPGGLCCGSRTVAAGNAESAA